MTWWRRLAGRRLRNEAEAIAQKGLSIVLIQQDGGQLVAYEPPQRAPLLEGTATPEVEPVPSDTEAEGAALFPLTLADEFRQPRDVAGDPPRIVNDRARSLAAVMVIAGYRPLQS
jgi:hypothetical protein